MQPTGCGTAGTDVETVSSMHHARQDRDGDGTSARDSESSVLLHGNRRRAMAPTDAQIRDGVAQERVGRGAISAYCCRCRTVRLHQTTVTGRTMTHSRPAYTRQC